MLVLYHKFAEYEKKMSKIVLLFLFFIVSLQPMNRTDLTQGSIWGNITTWLGSLFSVIICVVVYRWMVKHHKFSHSIVAS